MKLTAIIPTYNEEIHIKAAIESVSFADEIMIVDSYSTDNTLEIAKQYTDFIIQREYKYSASQKNWAIPQASNEWILLLDADEVVTPELQEEIKLVLQSNPKESGFWIYRTNYFMGKHMKHSGLNTDKVIRLFKRDQCKYEDKHVHAEIYSNGEIGYLKHKLIHNTYITLDKHLEKKNKYAWWSAKDHFIKNNRLNPFNLAIKPLYRFIKHYFIQLGFLDGVPGLAYAFIESYGVFTRYLKIWLLNKGLDEEKGLPKPKFLLYVSYSYGIPILRPVELKLKELGFDVAWFAEEKSTKENLSTNDVLLHTKRDVLRYRPSIILATANEVPPFFPGMKVQIFHGFSVSKRSDNKGHFRIRGLFDLYCTQGPSTTLPFKKLEEKHKHFKVIETGWPKMDYLFPLENNQNEKPTILLASTFTESLSLAHDDEVFKVIEQLILKKKYDWIITLHPKMDKKIVEKFKKLALKNQLSFVEKYDNLNHLKKADVLLTDTSSVITEFIIQQKSVVTYKNRKPQAYLLDTKNPNDIENNIDTALKKPADLMKSIKEFTNNEHPYFDGKSSERVITATLDFFNSREFVNLKPKPFNWLRKYKIRRRIK